MNNAIVFLPRVEIRFVVNKGWKILVPDENFSNLMMPIMTNKKFSVNDTRYWKTLDDAILYVEHVGLNNNYAGNQAG